MKFPVLNIDGSKASSIELSDKLLKLKVNHKLIKFVIDWQLNHAKPRTAKTKQRNEIKGSTKKIIAQKGSGGARHASKKAPLFVGGGVAHGPKGENNHKKRKINKSEKKMSIISLITEKNKNSNLIIFNDFSNKIQKTKEMYNILKKHDVSNSLMILDNKSKLNIFKSLRNLPNIKATDINHFSTYDVLKYKKLVFTETSIKELEKRYGK